MLMPQRKRLGFAVGAVEVNRAAKAQFPRFFFTLPMRLVFLGDRDSASYAPSALRTHSALYPLRSAWRSFFSSTTVRQSRSNSSCSSGVMAHSWESEIQNLPRNVPTSSGRQRTGSGEHCRGCERVGILTPQISVLQGSSGADCQHPLARARLRMRVEWLPDSPCPQSRM